MPTIIRLYRHAGYTGVAAFDSAGIVPTPGELCLCLGCNEPLRFWAERQRSRSGEFVHFKSSEGYYCQRCGMIRRAKDFAAYWHGAQQYGDQPYMFHLEQVVEVLREFNLTTYDYICTAYLHDVLEDTQCSYHADLAKEFADSAYNVFLLTDPGGATRAIRKERLLAIIVNSRLACQVKMADRIANWRYSIASGNTKKHEMYANEYPAFRMALYRASAVRGYDRILIAESVKMWAELDRLFHICRPEVVLPLAEGEPDRDGLKDEVKKAKTLGLFGDWTVRPNTPTTYSLGEIFDIGDSLIPPSEPEESFEPF